jgi:uncharacterized protein YbjT (DUF2867 family)
MARGELRLPIGDITLAPIDVVDIAKIAVAVLRAPGQEGKAYSITGPEALTGEQIAQLLSETAGLPVKYVAITPEERHREMLAAGAPTYFADALLEQSIERLRNPNATIHLEAHCEFDVKPTYFADFAKRNASVFATSAAAL